MSEYAYASIPSCENLYAASLAITEDVPTPKIKVRGAFDILSAIALTHSKSSISRVFFSVPMPELNT